VKPKFLLLKAKAAPVFRYLEKISGKDTTILVGKRFCRVHRCVLEAFQKDETKWDPKKKGYTGPPECEPVVEYLIHMMYGGERLKTPPSAADGQLLEKLADALNLNYELLEIEQGPPEIASGHMIWRNAAGEIVKINK